MATIDSYSEANQDSEFSLTGVHPAGGARSAIGQSFTGLAGYKLMTARFYIRKAGAPVGNLVAVLSTHSGVFGVSSQPTGAALATSNSVAIAGLGGALALVTFTFPAPNYMLAAINYCIDVRVLDAVTIDAVTNYVPVGRDVVGPTHAGIEFDYFGGWENPGAYDTCFYVDGIKSIRGNVVRAALLAATH